jgi:hypothetical protein
LLAENGSENADEEASCSQPPSSMESVSHDFVQNRLRKFDSFVSNITNNRNKKCESVIGEFDTYIKEGLLKRSEIFDILGWWNHNGLKYPILQRLARDILAIPVTTVASKSAFSTSGRLLSPHRSRFHLGTLEALMCAQSWLWSELKGKQFICFMKSGLYYLFFCEYVMGFILCCVIIFYCGFFTYARRCHNSKHS